MSYAASQWWNTRAQQRQSTYRLAPTIPATGKTKQAANSLSRVEIKTAWQSALAHLIDTVQASNPPPLPAKCLKVLRRLEAGARSIQENGRWRLSDMGRAFVKPSVVKVLKDKCMLTFIGPALARIA